MSSASSLRFIDDSQPGISRRKRGRHSHYFLPDGTRITDADHIAALNKIGLPPAYSNAWFALDAEAHILATGIDEKGRKQYRYHPDFRAEREAAKFDACAAFGRLLPRIRARIEKDLAGRALSRERAIASVVRLLDSGRVRIGNEAYRKANQSFGATTLRMRHVRIKRNSLHLQFKAKSGKICRLRVTDKSLIRFVRQMQDLPGQNLFQYVREDGEISPVTSTDVNAYVREAMDEHFTAKHFRTWAASALAFEWLALHPLEGSLKDMMIFVAEHLGNTPAIARKSYVHPILTEIAKDKEKKLKFAEELCLPRQTKWLSRYERGLIAFLSEPAQGR